MSRGDHADDRISVLRAAIDAVDDAIAEAVARRRDLVRTVREEKAQRDVPFLDPDREAEIAARYQSALPSIDSTNVQMLVAAVLTASR